MALGLGMLQGAEPVSPLIGLTKEQLMSRLGEPRSQLSVGDRLVYLYARDRVVLLNDVVVEVEPLPVDPPRRAPEPAPAAPPATPTPPATPPAAPVAGPGAATPPVDSAGRAAPAGSTTPPNPSPGAPVVTPPVTAPASEPKVEIKLVRPPGSKDLPPPPARSETPTVRSPPETPAAVDPARPVPPNPIVTAPSPRPSEPLAPETPPPAVDEKAKAFATAAELEKKAARRRLDEAVAQENAPSLISGKTILIGLVVLVGGIGLLIWRFRQRQLELAATSVANTPLPATPAVSTAPVQPKVDPSVFTAATLERLDWPRFDELVAAYYSKTGVVAARTLAGPEAPVHVKISWKGEPRPFAYVQCVLAPAQAVDARHLQALLTALAADDIRRGHVVTTGKFSAAALKLAEEKRITLLSGDSLIEKLNALPSAARLEIAKIAGAV